MKRTLTKAMIAEMFGVSRSAVAQSTKTKSLTQDLKARIIRSIIPEEREGDWIRVAKAEKLALIKVAKAIFNRRASQDSSGMRGRPTAVLNYMRIVKIINRIFKQFTSNTPRYYGRYENERNLLVRFMYRLNEIQNRRWKIPIEELLI